MKLYKVMWSDPTHSNMQEWFGSFDDANKAIPRIKQEYPEGEQPDCTVSKVAIPTDKKGLISWLNAHFDTDNG